MMKSIIDYGFKRKKVMIKQTMNLNRFNKLGITGKQHTALITGASSGLGETYAQALSQSGFNLIITARREEKLNTLKELLEKKHGVSVSVIPADLGKPGDISRLEKEIKKTANLSLLINNAGFGSMDYFADIPEKKMCDMLNVHIIATTRLCKAAVPVMKQNKSGYIINVSSLVAFMPIATVVMYHSTKSYIVQFSEVLQQELFTSQIKVQALCPGFIATEFLKNTDTMDTASLQMKAITMQPEQVVEESLGALRKKKVLYIPGRLNRLMYTLFHNRPGLWLIKKAAGGLMKAT
jgi:uncharacterized protein